MSFLCVAPEITCITRRAKPVLREHPHDVRLIELCA